MEGFTHLIPFAAGHEIIRQGRRDLTLIRMTPDLIYDQLIGAGLRAQAGLLLGRQPRRRLAAPLPRRGGARLAAPAGDRGAQPRRHGQPLRRRRVRPAVRRPARLHRHRPAPATTATTIKPITCPFTGETLTAVPALRPDVAVIHAQRADRHRQRAAVGHHRRAEGGRARRPRGPWSPSRRSSTSSTRGPARSCCPAGRSPRVAEVPGGAHPSYAHGYSTATTTTTGPGTPSAGTATTFARLAGRARATAGRRRACSDRPYTADEMMTVAAARALRDGIACFVGIGLPSTAANLARATHAPDLVLIYESGHDRRQAGPAAAVHRRRRAGRDRRRGGQRARRSSTTGCSPAGSTSASSAPPSSTGSATSTPP